MWKLQGRFKDRIAAFFLNLIYPSQCPQCGRPSDSYLYSPICRECFDGIRPFEGHSCRICSRPLQSGNMCGECLKEPPPYLRAISYGIYTGTLKDAINHFKFSGIKRLAGPLGELLSGLDIPQSDYIVPVPLDIHGLRKRGFNQTLLLAIAISKARGIPVRTGLLCKIQKTLPQVGLLAAERAVNLKGAFAVNGRLKGDKVLLLDDVMTTGTTLEECSKVLLRAGAGSVSALILARAGEY